MVTKELSEAAVEFNSILEYTSEDLKNKIPKKFLDFLQSIQSKTYKFEYDKTKKLDEQKLKLSPIFCTVLGITIFFI